MASCADINIVIACGILLYPISQNFGKRLLSAVPIFIPIHNKPIKPMIFFRLIKILIPLNVSATINESHRMAKKNANPCSSFNERSNGGRSSTSESTAPNDNRNPGDNNTRGLSRRMKSDATDNPTYVALRILHLKYAMAIRMMEFITTALTLDGRAPVRMANISRNAICMGTNERGRIPVRRNMVKSNNETILTCNPDTARTCPTPAWRNEFVTSSPLKSILSRA